MRLIDDGFHICKLIKSKVFEIFCKPKTCNVVCLPNVFYSIIVKSYPLSTNKNSDISKKCWKMGPEEFILFQTKQKMPEMMIKCVTILDSPPPKS